MAEPKVLVVMGSDSDYELMKSCLKILRKFEIGFECMVCSAHRTPDEAANLAKNAIENGLTQIRSRQGSIYLVYSAYTTLPVIGVPIVSGELDGRFCCPVQMPPGIPVANVAINGALNAGILACEILSLKYDNLRRFFWNTRMK